MSLAKKASRFEPDANKWMILALAYHESGQHVRAIRATERAIRLADAAGDAQQADSLRRRLEVYRNEFSPKPARN